VLGQQQQPPPPHYCCYSLADFLFLSTIPMLPGVVLGQEVEAEQEDSPEEVLLPRVGVAIHERADP
jgi:hypothetical protein